MAQYVNWLGGGSFVGAYIADLLHGKVFGVLIAGMALFMGLKMLLAKNRKLSRPLTCHLRLYKQGPGG